MRIIITTIILTTLLACNSKKEEDKEVQTPAEKPGGSTLDNINNSEYAVVQFNMKKKPCFAIINQYFNDYKGQTAFPYSLHVTIEVVEKNSKGHPAEKEAALLSSIEDTLTNQFISSVPFCYIGRATCEGTRDLIMYVADKDKAKELMNKFIEQNNFNRKIEFKFDFDPKWDAVSEFYE